MSSKTYIVVLTNPASADHEAAYNAWYDDVHIPEITALPGVLSATRFMLTPEQPEGSTYEHAYLALYEIDGSDVQRVLDTLDAAQPLLTATDTVDLYDVRNMIFREVGTSRR